MLSFILNEAGLGLAALLTSGPSIRTSVVFLRDQFAMPRQQGFGCDNGCDLSERFATERFRFHSQSAMLAISKSNSAST
jgi:hypothetical protein